VPVCDTLNVSVDHFVVFTSENLDNNPPSETTLGVLLHSRERSSAFDVFKHYINLLKVFFKHNIKI